MARFMYPGALLVSVLFALSRNVAAVWPRPQSISTGTTHLRLASDFSIDLAIHNPPQDLQEAVTRTKSLLYSDKLQLLVPDRGQSLAGSVAKAKQLKTLVVTYTGKNTIQSISTEAVGTLDERKESYSLHVPNDGSSATLSAGSSLGLFRGLTTFSQLWYYVDDTVYTLESPISVEDSPAYPYRGFMLDTARNYFPVSRILTTLDALSYTKINTFHWHIVDSQSFPLQLKQFPELSDAAYDSSSVYTESDVQNIISYAAARGIDVVVEIDTPGHTAAISVSHPDYIACNDFQPWSMFANEPPAGQLRFADPTVISFVQSLFRATGSLFPSKYFSTGGDEINTPCYDQDGPTQKSLQESHLTFEEGLSAFTQQTHSVLEEMGKTPVVWEEMVLDHNVTLSNDTIVMVWISSEDAAQVVEKGFHIVHAASDYFYLDCGAGGWVGNNVEGNSWCEPFKTWQLAYSFDPLANISESQQHLVLGGEQLLWTEQSGPQNMDSIVWPRAGASAEVFWTGANRNVSEALPRLHEFRYRLVQRGINAINLQPEWCALRPHACDFIPSTSAVPSSGETNSKDNMANTGGTVHKDTMKQFDDTMSFTSFLRNHVQNTLQNFLGFNPFVPVEDVQTIGSEDISDNAESTICQDEGNSELKKKNASEHNHDITVSDGHGSESDSFNLRKEKETKHQKPTILESEDSSLKSEEKESFAEFLKKHVKKRAADYLNPIVPREAHGL